MFAKPILSLFLFIFYAILTLFYFYACSERKPKSVKEQDLALEQLKDVKPIDVLPNNTSLLTAIKNKDLLTNYNINSYAILDQDSLFQKINGAADGYIKNHGFVECAYLEISHKVHKQAKFILYVYDMNSPIQAFGIYSSERNPSYNFIDIKNQGYLEGTTLSFWKNKYYVKLELQSSIKKFNNLLLALAKRISNIIPQDKNTLKTFSIFPKQNIIPFARRFYFANFDSQPLFKNVYQVFYDSNLNNKKESPYIFIAKFQNQQALKNAFNKYKDFLELRKRHSDKNISVFFDPLENSFLSFGFINNYIIGTKGFDIKNAVSNSKSIINNINSFVK